MAPTGSVASFGGHPDVKSDVAASGVFIALYALLGLVHMFIFQRNKRAGHFFIFNGLTFGFCMSRIVTFTMQIVWAKHPRSVSTAVVANIFISAGVVLLFIMNMNFAQRIVRAFHPRFYDSKPFYYVFIVYYASLVVVLIMVIATTIQYASTTDPSILNTDMNFRKFGSVWFIIFTFAPIPLILVSKFTSSSEQNFGKMGSLSTKTIIVLVTATTLTLSTGVRISGTLAPARPSSNPYWFQTRTAFYIFLGALEICVVTMLAVTRVDQRFFVPGKAESVEAEEKAPSLMLEEQATGAI